MAISSGNTQENKISDGIGKPYEKGSFSKKRYFHHFIRFISKITKVEILII